ncbi:uncharacterized protein TrAFT101_002861 [Trichoderma asperellum]|uniref:uncharacterized protein n=1 Tax=Trichoderma asperellum TaxID=101201 RepID=UPI00331808D1|nr:hypothetical protein TrAFT101_002861 [Trichoderma asperellum]
MQAAAIIVPAKVAMPASSSVILTYSSTWKKLAAGKRSRKELAGCLTEPKPVLQLVHQAACPKYVLDSHRHVLSTATAVDSSSLHHNGHFCWRMSCRRQCLSASTRCRRSATQGTGND